MASDAIDAAVQSYLAGDSTLSALLTGGVHNFYEWDTDGMPPLTPPYALVWLYTAKDVREMRRRAWEECRYIVFVEAGAGTTLSTVQQACARIDQLLDGGTFSISGYTLLKSERERRFAGVVQMDELDSSGPYTGGVGYGGLYMIWAQAS
jgi:hypothetical protein